MSGLEPRSPDLVAAVGERELQRLLGLPRGRALDGDLAARADAARAWYRGHGRAFAAAARVDVADVSTSVVRLADGSELRSPELAAGLRATRGHAVVALAVSAGREVAAEVARLWSGERPDEAYFLDRFATAVTEALVPWATGELCRLASGSGETLLPPRSPGCGRFEIGDQQCVVRLLGAAPVGDGRFRLGPIELLPTGALAPPQSLVAVLGVTRQPLTAATPEDLCRSCDLDPCSFRRTPAPTRRARQTLDGIA